MESLPKPKNSSSTEVKGLGTWLTLHKVIQPKNDDCSTNSSGSKRPPKLRYLALKRSQRDSIRSSIDESDQVDKLNFSLDNLDDSAFDES